MGVCVNDEMKERGFKGGFRYALGTCALVNLAAFLISMFVFGERHPQLLYTGLAMCAGGLMITIAFE